MSLRSLEVDESVADPTEIRTLDGYTELERVELPWDDIGEIDRPEDLLDALEFSQKFGMTFLLVMEKFFRCRTIGQAGKVHLRQGLVIDPIRGRRLS